MSAPRSSLLSVPSAAKQAERSPRVPPEVSGSLTMSRALAESAHGLTLNEARVMLLAIRRVDPLRAAELQAANGFVQVRVTASEFAALGEFSPRADGGTPVAAYEGLRSACDRLFERSATWRDGKKVTRMRWVWKAQYCEGEGWAEVCFAPDLTPHLFAINERFVRYRLEYARGLRSIYATNLLRLLMTQRDTGFKAISLEDFRHVMEVPATYRYADIKKHILGPAIAELNKKADLAVEALETKKGRAVSSLQFRFKFLRTGEGGAAGISEAGRTASKGEVAGKEKHPQSKAKGV